MAYLNPKNIALIVMALLVASMGGLYLWQRSTLKAQEIIAAKMAATILAQDKELADARGQIADYQVAIKSAQKTQAEQHYIGSTTEVLRTEIRTIKAEFTLEASDEKILSDVTDYFNARGLRRDDAGDRDPETGAEVLPGAGTPDPGRPHWTVRQIVENYLTLIDYTLKLERTVECYGPGNSEK